MSAAGECIQCGNLTVLNEGGLCAKCKDLPACTVHAEYLSSARCLGCRLYHCSMCLAGGRCEACRAKPAATRAKKGGGKALSGRERLAAYLAEARKNPVKAGAPILGLLIAVRAMMFAVEAFGQEPPMTPEERIYARVAFVSAAVTTITQERGRPPQTAKEIRTELRRQGHYVPSLQTTEKVLLPHTVIYLPSEKGYEIMATDANGEMFKPGGLLFRVRSDS